MQCGWLARFSIVFALATASVVGWSEELPNTEQWQKPVTAYISIRTAGESVATWAHHSVASIAVGPAIKNRGLFLRVRNLPQREVCTLVAQALGGTWTFDRGVWRLDGAMPKVQYELPLRKLIDSFKIATQKTLDEWLKERDTLASQRDELIRSRPSGWQQKASDIAFLLAKFPVAVESPALFSFAKLLTDSKSGWPRSSGLLQGLNRSELLLAYQPTAASRLRLKRVTLGEQPTATTLTKMMVEGDLGEFAMRGKLPPAPKLEEGMRLPDLLDALADRCKLSIAAEAYPFGLPAVELGKEGLPWESLLASIPYEIDATETTATFRLSGAIARESAPPATAWNTSLYRSNRPVIDLATLARVASEFTGIREQGLVNGQFPIQPRVGDLEQMLPTLRLWNALSPTSRAKLSQPNPVPYSSMNTQERAEFSRCLNELLTRPATIDQQPELLVELANPANLSQCALFLDKMDAPGFIYRQGNTQIFDEDPARLEAMKANTPGSTGLITEISGARYRFYLGFDAQKSINSSWWLEVSK